MANQRCLARRQHEVTKYQLRLLEKQIAQHHSTSSFDMLPISHVPLFDSINDTLIREQFYTKYKQVIEKSKIDMFNLYISSATAQMQHYEREHLNGIQQMQQDQCLLPEEQKFTPIMIDLIEQRANLIAERIKCIYDFKAQTLSLQL